MELRQASAKDTGRIKEIVSAVLEEYGLEVDLAQTNRDLDTLEASYIEAGGAFVVLTEGSEICACAGLYPLNEQQCELRKMYMLPAYRGRGWGKMLLEHLLTEARRLGFRQVLLETAGVLKEALGLYKRYGFQPHKMDQLSSRCDQAMALDLT